jgi:hypothetical protein
MFDIEDVHRLLEVIELEISRVGDIKEPDVDVRELGRLCLIVTEVMGWERTAYTDTAHKLGVSPSLLNKFMKMRGVISQRDAWVVAQRVRSFLRSHDQASDRAASEPAPADPLTQPAPAPTAFTAAASEWKAPAASQRMKAQIAGVSALLDTIIQQVNGSNYPNDEQVLTEIERAQLVAILETALAFLKAPLVERGLLGEAQHLLGKAAKSAAEKQTQQGLGALAELAKDRIAELVSSIWF